MTDKQPRKKHPLTIGKAYDKLAALHADRREACDKAVQKVHATYAERENAILAQLSEGDAEKVRSLLHDSDTTDFVSFGVDQKDSERLEQLRMAIDDHLGWLNQEQEEESDYVARVIGVRVELDKLRAELNDRGDPAPPEVATTGEAPGIESPVARNVREPSPENEADALASVASAFADDVPERLRNPLPPERLAVGRKR